MNQIALSFDAATALPGAAPAADVPPHPAAGFDATGFAIGWDHARHGLTPPPDHLHDGHPVRQGWQAGRAALGVRALRPSRQVRQWLGLRLAAWLRGRAFEDVMVTPRFLAQIDVARCPVTRETLSQTEGSPTEAVPLALFEGAGCAAGNLAVVSRRAAEARGTLTAAEARAVALRLEGLAGPGTPAAPATGATAATELGLDAAQWRRLAALLSLSTPTPHAQAAALPLAVLPPNRVRLLNPVQAVQAMLTLLLVGLAYARRMTDLAALLPQGARRPCFLFMNTLLARRLAAGWSADRDTVRAALEDAWRHPVVRQRWAQLAATLSAADCERVARLAAQRGLTGAAWRWHDEAEATDGWALETGGLAQAPAVRLLCPVQARPPRARGGSRARAPGA